MLVLRSLDWWQEYPSSYWSTLMDYYKFGALIFHLLLLLVFMLVTANGGTLYDWEILIFPGILRELRIYIILLWTPKVTMKSLELLAINFVLSSSNVSPHIVNITWMEPIAKELSHNLFESFKINRLVWKLRHVPKCLIGWLEFDHKEISKFFTMLWLPIIRPKQSYEIILQ